VLIRRFVDLAPSAGQLQTPKYASVVLVSYPRSGVHIAASFLLFLLSYPGFLSMVLIV
jgi:hypothetical protein